MKAPHSFKVFVTIYQKTRHKFSQNLELQQHKNSHTHLECKLQKCCPYPYILVKNVVPTLTYSSKMLSLPLHTRQKCCPYPYILVKNAAYYYCYNYYYYRAIPLLHLWAFVACCRVNFNFTFNFTFTTAFAF